MSNTYIFPPNPPTFHVNSLEKQTFSDILNQMLHTEKKDLELSQNKEKLCPFRKKIYFKAKESWPVYLRDAEFAEEEFLPCLHEKCGMWARCGC